MRNIQRKTQLQRIAYLVTILQTYKLSKQNILNKLEVRFNHVFSESQIEKDMFCLKMDFDASIQYDKASNVYSIDSEYDFKQAVLNFLEI